MDSDWMNDVASALAKEGVRVVRFEFPYMEARRSGKNRPPDRLSLLLATYRDMYEKEAVAGRRVFIGGKSMGGRIASMIADEVSAGGVVCFGYPFIPVGKNEIPDDRVAHLLTLRTPALILQGTRDPFGTQSDIASLHLRPRIVWIPDGDHDLKPRVKSGFTHAAHLATAAETAARFMLDLA